MPKLILDGDAKGAVQATGEVAKGMKQIGDETKFTSAHMERQRAKFAEGLKEQKRLLAEAAREGKLLGEQAARIVRENETGQERYNRKVQELGRLFVAGKLGVEQMDRALARHRGELQQVTTANSNAFGAKAIGQLTSYVTGLVSISGVLSLVKMELAEIQAEAERVTQAQLTGAQARDVLKRNISPLGLEGAKNYEMRAGKLAVELGLPQRTVDIALAEAYSASGDVEASFNRTRVAGQYLKTSPDQIGSFAGSLGDTARATKDSNDLRNLGFLGTIGAMSRVADANQQARTLPPALVGGVSMGMSAEEAGALWAALTVQTGDIRGDESGTGLIRATQQLRDFANERGAPPDVDTFSERLAMLRSEPGLAGQFLEKASFEAKVRGPLEQFFLSKDSDISKQYATNLGLMGTPAEQTRRGQETLQLLGEGALAKTAATERTITSGVEGIRMAQPSELSQESREGIIQTVSRLQRTSILNNRIGTFMRTGGTMSREEGISELEAALPTAKRAMSNTLGSLNDDQKEVFAEQIETQKTLIENTQQMIHELRELNGKTRNAPVGVGRPEK